MSVEAGGGGTLLFGDLKNKPIAYGGHVNVDYYFTPFISAGIQGQMGKLRGHDISGRDANNRYSGANANIKLRVGQFVSEAKNYSLYSLTHKTFWSYLLNAYVGVGLGFLYIDADAYRGGSNDQAASEIFAGKDYVYEMMVPINVGIDIPFGFRLNGPVWAVNVNYQLGVSFGDNLDGYTNYYSSYYDRMAYFSLGLKRSLF